MASGAAGSLGHSPRLIWPGLPMSMRRSLFWPKSRRLKQSICCLSPAISWPFRAPRKAFSSGRRARGRTPAGYRLRRSEISQPSRKRRRRPRLHSRLLRRLSARFTPSADPKRRQRTARLTQRTLEQPQPQQRQRSRLPASQAAPSRNRQPRLYRLSRASELRRQSASGRPSNVASWTASRAICPSSGWDARLKRWPSCITRLSS
ncbi:MAG: hypothetical protein AW07_03923 [Candidatus Accumulibacter sp. SK-11]|nr:MAG: hypothetical protein AW07_03923 [Candidatus Accumulibacter sp. SK-11]